MKATKATLLTLYVAICSFRILAQPCSCHELLKGLITKVEANYAGFIHKVKEQNQIGVYSLLKGELIQKAASTNYVDCYHVLSQYVRFFNDGHLFIIELPRTTPEQSDSLGQFIKRVDLSEKRVQGLNRPMNADPLEGIWKDESQKIAILSTGGNKFIGVTLENTNPKWNRGIVKMEIVKVKSNEYDLTIYRNDFAPIRFTQVRIYKNCLLPFGVYRFAKSAPSHPELNYIDTNNPEMPVFRQLDAKNCLITVPTALINRTILDSVLRKNEQAIKSTDNLIIDIRGNLGGNYIWGPLQALANTKEYPDPQKENEDDFLMLASEDNADYVNGMASYVRDIKDSVGIAYYDTLINKLKQYTGQFIGFSFFNPVNENIKRPVHEFPKKVVILMDKGTASAGEAFVLSMKANSNKVIVYGENSYGMIDYMNTSAKKIPCPGNNAYYYGYPTFFAPSIKTEPINPTGIKPDVYVPAGTADWVQWVKKHLVKQ